MNSYSFYQNKECEFFPCHEIDNEDDFNCLFCFCPLYCFGDKCGGNYFYLPNGIKNCENCLKPHIKQNYEKIIEELKNAKDFKCE
ncbi:MAG: cysteine-rich small domain-containing protein [Clostridia bacterium]|nr:cysteine-rich small domain-containing protein [Clostridia bacterium]